MVRLLFLLSGISVLAAGPLSYRPETIAIAHVKSEPPCPVNAQNCQEQVGATLQQ